MWLLDEPSHAAQIACTPTSGFSICFQYTYSGADQTITIPNGITSVDVRVFGAAGGGANLSWYSGQGGGAGGGFTKGTVAVSGAPTLTIVVGQGGAPNSTTSAYGGGGPGGGSSQTNTIGGSGGGYSGVFSLATKTAASAFIIGGGGGGASPGADFASSGAGGGGGATGGQDAVPVSSGRGGTASAGGAAATGTSTCSTAQTAGTQFNGGSGGTSTSAGSHEGGGGGGGGYFGGGGGLCQSGATQNGGGGGGSSFTGGTGVSASSTSSGSNWIYAGACSGSSTSGGAADSLYTSGIGVGSCYGTGGNGLVTVQYAMPTITLTKISNGGVGGFTFTGTNGWSSQTITTVTAGTGVVGAMQALAAISTATTITETPAAGFVATALSCTGLGSSGTATLTGNVISLNAAAAAEGANIACTITNTKLPTVTLTKISNGAVGGFTFTGGNGWSSQTISTVTSGTAVAGATQTLTAAATSTTITEAIPAGYALASATCTGLGSGGTATLASNVLTLDAAATAAGSAIACTFTNTKIPTFKVQVTSQAGTGGPVRFGQTNLAATPANIIPTALNILEPSSPTAIDISTIGTAVTLSQVIDFRYDVVAASCTDSNSAITGNTGTFSSLTGPLGFETVTIPAANVVAGANFTCVLTVKRITRLVINSTTLGGVGTTGFALPINLPSQNLTTVTPNVAVAGTAGYFTSMGVSGTITVTPISGYTLTGVSCTDTDVNGPWGTGSISTNFPAGTFTLPATMVVYGANYSCTATTSKTPTLKLQKTTSGGFGGPFTFSQTNLASTPASITTTAASTTTPTTPIAINVSTIGTAVTLTETVASGYFISGGSCTDANSAITTNTGSFGTLVGTTLTIPLGNVVAGAVFTCVFTNTKAVPQLSIAKTSSTAGPVNVGAVITYTYKITNVGNVAMTDINVADTHNGAGVLSGPASEILFTDTAPTGDSTDAASNGTWDTIGVGDVVSFTATYTVTQHDVDYLQ